MSRRTRGEGRGTNIFIYFACLVISVLSLSSCGYTTKSLLPTHIKTVYVDNFVNKIDMTAEISNKKPYTLYKANLENDLTKGILERFIFDGNLKVVTNKDEADSILSGELIEYAKEPLRYDDSDNVTEFKVRVAAAVKFIDLKDNKVIWQETKFSGESSERTQGPVQKSADTATNEAIADLARRIVERTVEVW